jgi:hypothetical protein
MVVLSVVLCIGLVAALFLVATVGIDAIQGEPYRMVVRCAEGQTLVQFLRTDEGLASPEFRVNMPAASPQEVDLRSGNSVIPGCSIEFSDTTILPGRFKIRIGTTLFDVMERGIFVEGKEFDWQPRDPEPHEPK